jgi:hypothetical protein
MTDHLATPQRDGLPSSILAPRPPARVRVWVLILAIVLAFGAGWLTAGFTTVHTTAVPGLLPAETSAATPEPEVDDQDDSAFVAVATRDLDDFEKDLDDLQTTLDEDGFWRLLSNAVELNFNASQLRGHEAPQSIEQDWADGLTQLEENIDSIEGGITSRSNTKVQAGVDDARETLEGLREVVARVD